MASPARIPFSGQTDADGNASLTIQAPPTLFGVLTLAGECAGNPNWAMRSSGQPIAFGNGPQASAGPVLTNPGDRLDIAITGALANSRVIGTLIGTQHPTAEEAAANFRPAPNVVTVSSYGQPILIDSAIGVTPGGGAVTHTGIVVPAGTQTLMVIGTDQTFFAGAGHIDLTGEITNETYIGSEAFPTSPSTVPTSGVLYFPAIPIDTTLRAVYDAVAAVRVNFWMFALPSVPAISVINQVKSVLMNSLGFLLSTPTEVAANPLLGVTLSGANPAPWQRRAEDGDSVVSNVTPGAASITIPAAGAGVRIILNRAFFTMDNRSGAAQIAGIRIWDGASGATLKWFSALQANNNLVDRDGPVPGTFIKGSPNTAMTLDFSGGAVGMNESIAVGWYLST